MLSIGIADFTCVRKGTFVSDQAEQVMHASSRAPQEAQDELFHCAVAEALGDVLPYLPILWRDNTFSKGKASIETAFVRLNDGECLLRPLVKCMTFDRNHR